MNQNSQYLAQAIQAMGASQPVDQTSAATDPRMLSQALGAPQGSRADPGIMANLQQAGRSLAAAPGRAVQGLSGLFSLGHGAPR